MVVVTGSSSVVSDEEETASVATVFKVGEAMGPSGTAGGKSTGILSAEAMADAAYGTAIHRKMECCACVPWMHTKMVLSSAVTTQSNGVFVAYV
jgi:hypothetical protein